MSAAISVSRCRLPVVAIVSAFTFTGCISAAEFLQRRLDVARDERTVQSAHAQFRDGLTDPEVRRASQDVGVPWLAGRPQPLAREVTLPPALRARVDTTLMFSGGQVRLPQLAERIMRATGIPVRVAPEALLPPEAFLPRLHGEQNAALNAAMTAALDQGPQPLPRVLDRIAAQLDVHWRFADDHIVFYRTETRVFTVRALTLGASADARLGRSARQGTGGFDNTSNTSLTLAAHDTLDAVRARIEPFLTRAGAVAAQAGAGGTIVVTDTPPALNRVAAFLERENRVLTRRVRLLFEELTVTLKRDAHQSIDWSLVYAAGRAGATALMPGSAVQQAGALGASLGAGVFRGSEAIVSALSEMGSVRRHSSIPVMTLNRRPVTHAVRNTFTYIDQVQTLNAVSGTGTVSGNAPQTSVSQKEETVGSLLTLVPDVQDDGQILLSVAYDNTVAQPLKTITFGHRDTPMQLQQISVDGNGTVQQVALRPGQPMVISGFERDEADASRSRLGDRVPLLAGGQDKLGQTRHTTVVIVTAQVEED
ncbi:MAG: hypothetical protein ABW210_14715 [Achromobacter sp.]